MANRGRRGFTYTHYPPTAANQIAIQSANRLGFTVNLSAESLAQADAYADLGIAPVVVVLPHDAMKSTRTPAGRQVIVCPASTGNSDLNCGICQQRDRAASWEWGVARAGGFSSGRAAMTTSQVSQSLVPGADLEFDEAFLERVDRAGLLCKQRDPYRMDQVHRALEEEVQRVLPGDRERERTSRDRNGAVGINRWEAL